MSAVIWLHEGALRADHPVFSAAGDQAQTIFIWDAAYLQTQDYSFKRLVFLYECLCELPVAIYAGSTIEVLRQLSPTALYCPASPNPAIIRLQQAAGSLCPVELIADEPFVTLKKAPPLQRFFPYWNKARAAAIQRDGGKHD